MISINTFQCCLDFTLLISFLYSKFLAEQSLTELKKDFIELRRTFLLFYWSNVLNSNLTCHFDHSVSLRAHLLPNLVCWKFLNFNLENDQISWSILKHSFRWKVTHIKLFLTFSLSRYSKSLVIFPGILSRFSKVPSIRSSLSSVWSCLLFCSTFSTANLYSLSILQHTYLYRLNSTLTVEYRKNSSTACCLAYSNFYTSSDK